MSVFVGRARAWAKREWWEISKGREGEVREDLSLSFFVFFPRLHSVPRDGMGQSSSPHLCEISGGRGERRPFTFFLRFLSSLTFCAQGMAIPISFFHFRSRFFCHELLILFRMQLRSLVSTPLPRYHNEVFSFS